MPTLDTPPIYDIELGEHDKEKLPHTIQCIAC